MVDGNDPGHRRFLKHMEDTHVFTDSLLQKGGVKRHEH